MKSLNVSVRWNARSFMLDSKYTFYRSISLLNQWNLENIVKIFELATELLVFLATFKIYSHFQSGCKKTLHDKNRNIINRLID